MSKSVKVVAPETPMGLIVSFIRDQDDTLVTGWDEEGCSVIWKGRKFGISCNEIDEQVLKEVGEYGL